MRYMGLGLSSIGLSEDRGPFEIVTPARALSELRSIDTDMGSLARDIGESQALDADSKADFALFVAEWRAFYEDYARGPTGWFGRTQPNVLAKIDEYRKTLDSWRGSFVSRGGVVHSVARAKPSKWGPLPWIAVGGILAAGAYLYFKRDAGNVRSVQFRKGYK